MNTLFPQGNECQFSACRKYRFSLVHRWGTGNVLAWIGLNPSTADENNLDPTLRKIREFSKRAGYDGFVMLNLYAFRSTDPKGLDIYRLSPFDLDTRDNWPVILEQTEGRRVVCAWGQPGPKLGHATDFAQRLRAEGRELLCLGVNGSGPRKGSPKHPLYLSYTTPLRPFPLT